MVYCNLRVRRWHSINLLPHWSAVDTCGDDRPYRVEERVYAVTLFGVIFELSVPTNKTRRAHISEAYGPLYSRERRQWYTAKDPAGLG